MNMRMTSKYENKSFTMYLDNQNQDGF
jgi:hypothetical protein